jgi:hypothetical protein
MTEHTPGPWEISQEPPRWIIQAKGEIGKKAVAYMVGDFVKCAANARLIAAAPELMAALEDMLEFAANVHAGRNQSINYSGMDRARAAIAKARGEDK